MKLIHKLGVASVVLRIFLPNTASTTGGGKTGLTHASSGLIISTLASNESAATTYTAAGSTVETITTLGTYAAPTSGKCRFKEVDATNFPGVYEIQIADARYAVTSARHLLVSVQADNVAPTFAEVELVSVDLFDATAFGLSRLDAAISSRSTLTAANVWDALTTGMTTAGSIGKRIVDYLTGDSFTRLGAPVGASISADIAGAKSSADTAASNSSTAASAATTAASNASDAAGYASAAATQSTNAAASAASADGKATTILSRLGAWTGTGINTILGALRAIAAKASGLTPTDISTGTTFDNTTDSAEAIRDRGDAAWTGGGGGGGGGGVTLRRGPYQGKVNDGRPGAVVPLSVLDMVTLVIDVVDENGDEVPTGTATYTTEVRDRAGATVSTGTATPSDDSTRGRILWDNAAEDTESARTLYLYITRTDGAQVDTLRTIVLSIT